MPTTVELRNLPMRIVDSVVSAPLDGQRLVEYRTDRTFLAFASDTTQVVRPRLQVQTGINTGFVIGPTIGGANFLITYNEFGRFVQEEWICGFSTPGLIYICEGFIAVHTESFDLPPVIRIPPLAEPVEPIRRRCFRPTLERDFELPTFLVRPEQ